MLDRVFECVGVGLCVLDGRGCVVQVNARWRDTFGVPVVTRPLTDRHPELGPELARLFAETKGTSPATSDPVDVGPFAYTFTLERLPPAAIPDGVAAYFLLTAADVPETVDPSGRRSSPVSAHDTLLEGCQIIGFDWRYRSVNDSAAVHSRRPASELIGRTMLEVYPSLVTQPLYGMLERCLVDRTPSRSVQRFVFDDGDVGWFDCSVEPHPEGIAIYSIDITSEKRVAAALIESERSLREAQRLAGLGSWEVDAAGRVVLSHEAARILALDDTPELSFADLRRLCPSEAWPRVGSKSRQILAAGGFDEVEADVRRADGVVRRIYSRASAIHDANERIVGLRGSIQDVTDQRKTEESLRSVRDELAAVIEASPVAIIATDLVGNVVVWSSAAEQLFGWTALEAIGHPIPCVPDDERALFEAVLGDCAEGRPTRGIQAKPKTKDGRRVPVSVAVAPTRDGAGRPKGMVASVTDLTERETLHAALVESEERFANAFDASPVAKLIVRSADRTILEANRTFLALGKCTREQAIGQKTTALPITIPAADRAAFLEIFRRDGRVVDFESSAVVDEETRYVTMSAAPIQIGGEAHELLIFQDITDRRRAELALRESEERLRQLADAIEEVFWLEDVEKNEIVYISPAYERIWGGRCEQLYARREHWAEAIHPDDRERVAAAIALRRESGHYDEQYRIVRPDGDVRWIRSRAFPVRDAAGKIIRFAGAAQDVTTHRALEEQLRQTQKMESIGRLAGGVAHDFNNLLTVISGNCQGLEEMVRDVPEAAEILAEVREAGERAAALTHQLLAFSRREVIEKRVVDFDSVVADTEKMLRRIVGEDVVFGIDLDAQARVEIDPGSFAQVLMNLAVNARDAMPRGGDLRIKTRTVVLDAAFVATRPPLAIGPHVALTVADSGEGIPAELQARIFEPFFTTKGVGRGSGLGLSVVHGIITQSGGHIEVVSAPGAGTSFRIYLPHTTQAARPAAERREGPISRGSGTMSSVSAALFTAPAEVSGHETILVVDDEERIRKLASRALASAGYHVLQASNGDEALLLAYNYAARIDLVVTDVVMPSMGGRELAELMAKFRPETRILYTSGYTDDDVLRNGIESAAVAFLRKPYDVAGLRRKVRDVLDGEDDGGGVASRAA